VSLLSHGKRQFYSPSFLTRSNMSAVTGAAVSKTRLFNSSMYLGTKDTYTKFLRYHFKINYIVLDRGVLWVPLHRG
jgi:ABC-type transporter lipoprotein component MlaA